MSTGVIQEERTFHPYKMMHRIAIRVNTQLTLIAKKCKDTPSAWLTKYAFEKWCKEIEASRAPARNYMIQQRIEGIEWFVTDMHSHQQIAHTVKKMAICLLVRLVILGKVKLFWTIFVTNKTN